ncbi:hypothetical protein [Nannocystis pusilla]|uniref:hypothetical protein n=1 Tax=Nannocystis pusilla TaxID=889268 RepID=UPI003DA67AAF
MKQVSALEELRLEHRALAGDDAVVLRALGGDELGEHRRQLDLVDGAEVAARQLGIDGHDRQLELVVADDVAQLADHLLDADVGAGVARADVAGQQQLERLARLPRLGRHAEDVADGDALDGGGDGGLEGAVGVDNVLDLVPDLAGGLLDGCALGHVRRARLPAAPGRRRARACTGS